MHPFGREGALRRGLYKATEIDDFGLNLKVGRASFEAMNLGEDSDRWAKYDVTGARVNSTLLSLHGESEPCRMGEENSTYAFESLRDDIWTPEREDGGGNKAKLTFAGSQYKLSLDQMDAVGWYTSPQAGWTGGHVPTKKDNEPGQRDVAQALTRAIANLPSLGDLGLKAPAFRVTGGEDADSYCNLKRGTVVVHGIKKLPNNSYHFMSSSLTANVKGFAINLPKAGEVFALYGDSGRYIQWLGRHGLSMDGGEVLYTPGTVTRFEGKVSEVLVGSRWAPVYLLVECSPDVLLRESETIVEDFKLEKQTAGEELYKRVCDLRLLHGTAGSKLGRRYAAESKKITETVQELEFQRRSEAFFATATETTSLLSTPQRYGRY